MKTFHTAGSNLTVAEGSKPSRIDFLCQCSTYDSISIIKLVDEIHGPGWLH